MKKPKAPRLVTVAIFTTITIIFWVFFSLYNVFTSKSPAQVDSKLLEPLTPTLDAKVLSRLEGRIFFEESDITTPFTVNQPVNAPLPTPTPESIESTETATTSGVTP